MKVGELALKLFFLLNKVISRKCILCKYHKTEDYFCKRCSDLLANSTSKISNELGVFACYEYIFPFKHLVRNAKLQQNLPAYNALAQLMKQKISLALKNNLFSQPEAFTFVPSNDMGKKINHAEFLANNLGNHFNIKVIDGIIRNKNNKKQKMVAHKKERFDNMKNAFIIKNREDFLNIKKLVIIDDIYTTGATISALKQEILKVNPNLIIKTIVFSSHNNLLQNIKF